jgi:hypothetical protein
MKNKGNMREALFFLIPNQKWVSIKSQKESLIQRVNLKKTNHTQFRQKRKKKSCLKSIYLSIRLPCPLQQTEHYCRGTRSFAFFIEFREQKQ